MVYHKWRTKYQMGHCSLILYIYRYMHGCMNPDWPQSVSRASHITYYCCTKVIMYVIYTYMFLFTSCPERFYVTYILWLSNYLLPSDPTFQWHKYLWFNSWPSDATWHYSSGSTLAQAMSCFQGATNPLHNDSRNDDVCGDFLGWVRKHFPNTKGVLQSQFLPWVSM